jgi:hypothetical protein
MISADQESELHRFFSGAIAAAMGIKSCMGGQIAHLRLGITDSGNAGVSMEEDSLEAAWEYSRINGVLRTLNDGDRRVLRLLYEPLTPGETDWLETFGRYVRLAIVLCGDRDHLVRLCKASKKGKSQPVKQNALAAVYSLVFQATERARTAQEAYSAGCERRAQADYRAHPELHGLPKRPWYVPAVSRDRMVQA